MTDSAAGEAAAREPAPPAEAATGRLDAELVRRGLARSRGQARELLERGSVLVAGEPAQKPSARVGPEDRVELTAVPDPWVGRAAYKLLEALRIFGEQGLRVEGRRCLDVGASTGGFTQVLLHAGAASVVSLDVGHGQLAPSLARDPRVDERSGTNVRDVRPGDLGAAFDLVVADLSFISLRLALAPMLGQLRPDGDLLALVKPQFEVGRDRLARTGVVTSPVEHARVLRDVLFAALDLGLEVAGLVPSPIRGGDGNREYLVWVSPRPGARTDRVAVQALVEQVTEQAKGRP